MITKKTLELRKEISKRRPKFIQQDTQKRKEIKKVWRKPKGMHSKIRLKIWGRPAAVNEGYRGPKITRGAHSTGLMPITIYNVKQLEGLDPKTQGVITGHIGDKKKIALINKCKEKGLTILNIKNAEEKIKQITDKIAARKESKKEVKKTKEEKTKAKAEPKKEEPKTKEQERRE
ncbi:hypothetical protein KY309_02985, partial [Candidatus Woesearchaeota archaeon]|nr:hypothetical protein [Candidatus Woesearchaeota archaeon]